MSDEELLQRWRLGDRYAGHELVKRHYDAVFMFLWGKVDEQASADLTQDTFETLCGGRERFRGESSVRTYLFGIARWKLVNYLRATRRARTRFDPLHDGVESPLIERSITSLFAHKEHEALLVRALRSLPLDDQLLLELKEYEDLPARELAAIFELPAGTVAGRLARARERLRRAVQQRSLGSGLAAQTLEGLESYAQSLRATIRGVRAERIASARPRA